MGIESSLYIHIPFCAGCCDYCGFYSVPLAAPERADAFIQAVLADTAAQLCLFNVEYVPTVYLGGGTPSALGASRMARLLDGLAALLAPMRQPPREFTVEANPESADREFLRACRAGGVNRLSVGIQSFHEPSRRAVGRRGDSGILDERLSLAARYFPGAFSADLIAGLPLQTESVLRRDIERLLAFQPAHVSLYSLTLEPDTPLARAAATLPSPLPPPDEADAVWLAGRDALEAHGYAQYEVSNFSLPEKECAHNMRYWHLENWLGAGPAASGTLINERDGTARRHTFPPDLDAYLAAASPAESAAITETIDRPSLMRESLLMGFRLRRGLDQVRFERRFSRTLASCIPKTIARWRQRGFFESGGLVGGGLAPTAWGLLFVDAFLRDAFEELDEGSAG